VPACATMSIWPRHTSPRVARFGAKAMQRLAQIHNLASLTNQKFAFYEWLQEESTVIVPLAGPQQCFPGLYPKSSCTHRRLLPRNLLARVSKSETELAEDRHLQGLPPSSPLARAMQPSARFDPELHFVDSQSPVSQRTNLLVGDPLPRNFRNSDPSYRTCSQPETHPRN